MVQPKPTASQNLYNCPVKDCPINGLRLTSSILYQATIKCNNSKYKKKTHKGISETTTFKKGYANQKKSFNEINSKKTPPDL